MKIKKVFANIDNSEDSIIDIIELKIFKSIIDGVLQSMFARYGMQIKPLKKTEATNKYYFSIVFNNKINILVCFSYGIPEEIKITFFYPGISNDLAALDNIHIKRYFIKETLYKDVDNIEEAKNLGLAIEGNTITISKDGSNQIPADVANFLNNLYNNEKVKKFLKTNISKANKFYSFSNISNKIKNVYKRVAGF